MTRPIATGARPCRGGSRAGLRAVCRRWVAAAMLATAGAASVAAAPADPYFGLHVHGAIEPGAWPTIPFGTWRLWDAEVTWRDLQPDASRWDFRRLDQIVELGARQGVEMLLPLGLSPAWASSRPSESSAYGPGHAAPPRRLEDWERYVTQVVRRYKGRVAAYEFWNEPNDPNFFSGTVDEAVRLACTTYRIVKNEDPQARVVSPSATHQARGVEWFGQFLDRGGATCFDIVGFHFYTLAHEPPEAMTETARGLRQVLARHQLTGRPLWNTEAGWYIANVRRPVDVRWQVLDADTAAAYVARALVLGRHLGFQRFYWYAWNDGNLGLNDPDDRKPKPAGRAYARMVTWLAGASNVSCQTLPQSTYRCLVQHGTGTPSWIAWSATGASQRVELPLSGRRFAVERLDGQPAEPARGAVAVGAAPVRLTLLPRD